VFASVARPLSLRQVRFSPGALPLLLFIPSFFSFSSLLGNDRFLAVVSKEGGRRGTV